MSEELNFKADELYFLYLNYKKMLLKAWKAAWGSRLLTKFPSRDVLGTVQNQVKPALNGYHRLRLWSRYRASQVCKML